MSHPPPNPVPTKPPLGLFGGNVLVAAPSKWDEVCFSAPVVRAIRHARPMCTLGVVCPEEQGGYWRSLNKLNHVIPYGKGTSYRAMLREQRLRDVEWESAILWERNDGAQLAVDLKVKQRLGYGTKDLKKWLTDEMEETPIHGDPGHRVQHYLRFADRLNLPTQHPELFHPVTIATDQETGAAVGRVLVSPESDYGMAYEWEEQGWMQVLDLLQKKLQAKVTLVSCGEEKSKLATRLAAACGLPCERWESLGSVLPTLAGHALAICADSSLCHLTAHVGVTTIALFGPGNPHWRRPLGRQHAIIRHKVECSPCLLAKCPMDRRCQRELLFENWAAVISQKFGEGVS